MFLHQKKFIDNLLEYISEEVGVHTTPEGQRVLSAAVADRVGGLINGTELYERLLLPERLGGAAYDDDMAFKISRHLEKLIAQGGYIIQKNELLGAHT
jgi:hypothetical protein